MPEDIRDFYNEQDEKHYQILCGLIYIELKKSESNTTPGLSEKGVLDALPESFRNSPGLVRVELGYMVKDGLVSVTDEIHRVVAGKTPPHWAGLD